MLGLIIKTNDDFIGYQRLTKRETRQALFRSAGYVRLVAKTSIKSVGKKDRRASVAQARAMNLGRDAILAAYYPPSRPGTPPNTHTKQLPRSIVFAADSSGGSFVIGPSRSGIDEIGQVHEFGGKFRGRNYPARPFMRPAIENPNSQRAITENFQGKFKK
jgi:phage gpG-like protein